MTRDGEGNGWKTTRPFSIEPKGLPRYTSRPIRHFPSRKLSAMNRDDRLADLIDRWEELRREGKSPSATDLASESPELIGPLREWITAFDLADQMEARTATIGGRRWRLDAEHVSLVDLSNTILAHGLVTALDLDQSVADLERGKASPTANELSAALIGRGLLTAEQSQILLAGGGGELVVGEYVILDPTDRGDKQKFQARHRSRGGLVLLERVASDTAAAGTPSANYVRTKAGLFLVRETAPGLAEPATGEIDRASPDSPAEELASEAALDSTPDESQTTASAWSWTNAIFAVLFVIAGGAAAWFFLR